MPKVVKKKTQIKLFLSFLLFNLIHVCLSLSPGKMYSNYECNLNPTSFWTKGFAPKLNEYRNSALVGGGNCIVGSHSSTIDRLYAWEKKLFQEVKVNLL